MNNKSNNNNNNMNFTQLQLHKTIFTFGAPHCFLYLIENVLRFFIYLHFMFNFLHLYTTNITMLLRVL